MFMSETESHLFFSSPFLALPYTNMGLEEQKTQL